MYFLLVETERKSRRLSANFKVTTCWPINFILEATSTVISETLVEREFLVMKRASLQVLMREEKSVLKWRMEELFFGIK